MGFNPVLLPFGEAARVNETLPDLDQSVDAQECVENIASGCGLACKKLKDLTLAKKCCQGEPVVHNPKLLLQLCLDCPDTFLIEENLPSIVFLTT